MVGCTGRPTWAYSNGDLSICVHDVYRVTTCRPGRGISWRPPTYSFVILFSRPISKPTLSTVALFFAIQTMQRRFTKRLQGYSGYSYEKRLQLLKLTEFGNLQNMVRSDLVLQNHIWYGARLRVTPDQVFKFRVSSTRGHPFKLCKRYNSCRIKSLLFTERDLQ